MKLTVTIPYFPPAELRQRMEAFLTALSVDAYTCQLNSPNRPQFLELANAQPVAWVDPSFVPPALRPGPTTGPAFVPPPPQTRPPLRRAEPGWDQLRDVDHDGCKAASPYPHSVSFA